VGKNMILTLKQAMKKVINYFKKSYV
jgi:hypothetical protein